MINGYKIFKLFLQRVRDDGRALGANAMAVVNARGIMKRYYPAPVLQGGMRDSAWFEKIFNGSKTGVKSLAAKREKDRF